MTLSIMHVENELVIWQESITDPHEIGNYFNVDVFMCKTFCSALLVRFSYKFLHFLWTPTTNYTDMDNKDVQ